MRNYKNIINSTKSRIVISKHSLQAKLITVVDDQLRNVLARGAAPVTDGSDNNMGLTYNLVSRMI